MDKIDGRQFKPEGRNQLRHWVIRLRQQSGLSTKNLAKVAGLHMSTGKDWLALAKREGIGSLAERRRARSVWPVGSSR